MAAQEDDIFDCSFSDEEAENEEAEEESGDEIEQKRNALLQKAEKNDMVPYDKWWNKFESEMKKILKEEDHGLIPDAFKALKKASEATCLVKRVKDSEDRKEKMKKKEKQNEGGFGTGLLVTPRFCDKGWVVITNNHVIMNDDEAATAEVFFEYTSVPEGGKKLRDVYRTFKVKEVLALSPRTENSEDKKHLDYSLLLLETNNEDDEQFCKKNGVKFEESGRVPASFDEKFWKRVGLNGPPPLFMFSHPHNLPKHLSIGELPGPDSIKERPVSHIRHGLGTLPGSSGGNLLISTVDDRNFCCWKTAFVHYRHGWAVGWQTIAEHLREENAKAERQKQTELGSQYTDEYLRPLLYDVE